MSEFDKLDEQRRALENKVDFISEQLSAVLESNIKIMAMIDSIQISQRSVLSQQESLLREMSKLSAKSKDTFIMMDNIEKECEDVAMKCDDLSNKIDDVELAVHNIKIYKSVNDF